MFSLLLKDLISDFILSTLSGVGGRVSPYMEEGTDVRPEWPPFSGLEIYQSEYFFILKYMNPHKFSDCYVSFTRVKKITI